MIAYLRGRTLEISGESILLENGGVGYEIFCSGAAFQLAQSNRADTALYTYLQVKEDGLTLYGFCSLSEKQIFLDLISVSGVGPKLAIGILNGMRAEEVARCIATADVKGLSRVKGLGKKTAEKIVLELHGKVSAEELLAADGDLNASKAAPMPEADEEALEALLHFGFTRNECLAAVKRAREKGAANIEDIIRVALSEM